MIKQIGLPLCGRPILLITGMITDQIGLHSVLLPLLISIHLTAIFLNTSKTVCYYLVKLVLKMTIIKCKIMQIYKEI